MLRKQQKILWMLWEWRKWQCGQCEVIASRQTFNGFILLKISNIHLSLSVWQPVLNGPGSTSKVFISCYIFLNIHSTQSIFLVLFWALCARVPGQMAHYLATITVQWPLIGRLIRMKASDWSIARKADLWLVIFPWSVPVMRLLARADSW